MDLRLLLAGLIALAAFLELLTLVLLALRRKLREQRGQQPTIYAIGSPEDNARVVQALRQINERLAQDGRRVPERVAIDIVRQRTDGQGDDQ